MVVQSKGRGCVWDIMSQRQRSPDPTSQAPACSPSWVCDWIILTSSPFLFQAYLEHQTFTMCSRLTKVRTWVCTVEKRALYTENAKLRVLRFDFVCLCGQWSGHGGLVTLLGEETCSLFPECSVRSHDSSSQREEADSQFTIFKSLD